MLRSLLVLFASAWVGQSHAAGFEAKTMRESLSSREVERPLVLGKGWMEAALGFDLKNADGYWGPDGAAEEFDRAEWMYSTQSVTIRYGLAKRAELWWRLPWHYASLTNNKLGTETSDFGMGDPSFGYKLELFRSSAPTTSIIGEVFYKAPAGDDAPGNYIGGPNTFNNIVWTSGTPDMGVGIAGKRQYGPFAMKMGLQYTHRFSSAVGYLIETEFNQFQARIKPGDTIAYDLDLMLQVGPVALHSAWMVQNRQLTRIGTASAGLFGDANLKPVEESDGTSVDGQIGAVLNLTRGVDLTVDVRRSLVGEDLMFFPIEQIHPTRGTTYSTALELRY
jgi:hypothetical protein